MQSTVSNFTSDRNGKTFAGHELITSVRLQNIGKFLNSRNIRFFYQSLSARNYFSWAM